MRLKKIEEIRFSGDRIESRRHDISSHDQIALAHLIEGKRRHSATNFFSERRDSFGALRGQNLFLVARFVVEQNFVFNGAP